MLRLTPLSTESAVPSAAELVAPLVFGPVERLVGGPLHLCRALLAGGFCAQGGLAFPVHGVRSAGPWPTRRVLTVVTGELLVEG